MMTLSKKTCLMCYKNLVLTWFFLLCTLFCCAQADTVGVHAISTFQRHLNEEYQNPETSPLDKKNLKSFAGHTFFPVDLAYRVEATLEVTDKEPYFKMMTSNNRPRDFRQYGVLVFTLLGQSLRLPVYQSQQLSGTDEYADYLFFPFTDLTNGTSSYGAGRYIDLRIPAHGNTIVVDFNQAYNPLCAYSDRYSCPVVPEKNHINLEIKAGVAFSGKH
jgi:uncharacterized protein